VFPERKTPQMALSGPVYPSQKRRGSWVLFWSDQKSKCISGLTSQILFVVSLVFIMEKLGDMQAFLG
jgi:hypothetical protein